MIGFPLGLFYHSPGRLGSRAVHFVVDNRPAFMLQAGFGTLWIISGLPAVSTAGNFVQLIGDCVFSTLVAGELLRKR